VSFTPATNFIGIATVGYSITDGGGGTNFALITINVTTFRRSRSMTTLRPQDVPVTIAALVMTPIRTAMR